ncbi:MAG TPA: cytochrome c3 family protein [Longimicrobiales bacterium]
MKRFIAVASLVFAMAGSAVWAVARQDTFKHSDHARLFPVCTSCHAGVQSGEEARLYPAPDVCANCHDGQRERKVDWKGHARVATNLKFSHTEHVENSGEADCATCHGSKASPTWMNVSRAQPETCLACHDKTQQGKGPVVHLATSVRCTMCHVSLKDARSLDAQQIAGLPQPPSHKEAGFLATHKTTTLDGARTCSVCHTQESCARCHANAAGVKVIAALGSTERVAPLVANKKAVYPRPADHNGNNFLTQHGVLARAGVETCANCHTRNSCQQCHTGGNGADQLAQLPVRVAGLAPGVQLKSNVRSAHPAGFANAHGTQAGASGESCTSCHAQKFCSDCHQGADSRKFHPANFASRHAQSVYAGDGDCSSCHNRESFCQSCHTGLGMNSTGKRTTQFHNAQSVWLLQHGQPARQSLESCASCHTQSSCTRCHATNAKGGWGVSPHGSMNAASLKDKNQVACLRCHKSGT